MYRDHQSDNSHRAANWHSSFFLLFRRVLSLRFTLLSSIPRPFMPCMFCIMFIMLMQVFMCSFIGLSAFSASSSAARIFAGSLDCFAASMSFVV